METEVTFDKVAAKPMTLSSEEKELVEAQNGFALRLLEAQNTLNSGENIALSPLSAMSNIAMIANASDATTRIQILNLLGINSINDLNALNGRLNKEIVNVDASNVKFTLSNALWLNQDKNVKVDREFSSTLSEYYLAENFTKPFANPVNLQKDINIWAKGKTEGLIPHFYSENQPEISPEAFAVFLNAMFFKGRWSAPFDPELTSPRPFYNFSGASIAKPQMMTQCLETEYYTDATVSSAVLPYGDYFSMTVIVPRHGDDAAFAQAVEKALNSPKNKGKVQVNLPRFNTDIRTDLSSLYSHLGYMGLAILEHFDANETPGLNKLIIEQQCVLRVDEQGTEGASVTGAYDISATPDGSSSNTPVVSADRPFVYVISERSSGAILFIGRVNKP
ncbi:MAG: serpin family protein [Bacteroidales bacterium]|nr:serpin family protein [Bacteroidales bacterium]